MRVTKLVHSCLLVETPEHVALFDPGMMSAEAVNAANIERLDDIIISHEHDDHLDIDLVKQLVDRFPDAVVIAPTSVAQQLEDAGVGCISESTDEVSLFDSPHELGEPLFPTPMQQGAHYIGKLTHPGDSHSFDETMAVLALPVTAPWGATVNAVNLTLRLKPKYVIPIHDWHWSDDAQDIMYENIRQVLARDGIELVMAKNGQPFELEV